MLAIMLALVSVPTSAVKFTAVRDSESISGDYTLPNSASLDSDITLSKGVVSRLSSVSGSGKIAVTEGVLSDGSSVATILNSDGSVRFTNSDLALEGVAGSDIQATQGGPNGYISTESSGQKNAFEVVVWHSGEGNTEVSLSSIATPQEALTTGSASAMGTSCFSDELAQGIRGEDMAVSVHGLHLAEGKGIGEFGVVAQNAKPGGAGAKPTASNYKLAGYKWPSSGDNVNIPIYLSRDYLPNGGQTETVKTEIQTALTTWDASSSKNLFSPLGTITSATGADYGSYNSAYSSYGTRDYKNVHLWTSDTAMASNTIAMTVTWYNRITKIAAESDCWYNNRFVWYTDGVDKPGTSDMDIQTIALHELGHTIGLADLYESSNSGQVMYGYNSGNVKRGLADGDKAGLKALYG